MHSHFGEYSKKIMNYSHIDSNFWISHSLYAHFYKSQIQKKVYDYLMSKAIEYLLWVESKSISFKRNNFEWWTV